MLGMSIIFDMILSMSVRIFRYQPTVTLLIVVPYFCFLIHSLMMGDLKAET